MPYITYGIAVLSQTNLDTLQKRAVDLIHFAPYRSHSMPLFNIKSCR